MVFDRKRVFHVVLKIDNERANLLASFFSDEPDIGQRRRTRVRATKVALLGRQRDLFPSRMVMIDTPPVVNEQIPRCRSPSFAHSSEPATFESPASEIVCHGRSCG